MRQTASHPPLIILGYSEAAMLLRRDSPPRLAGIISVHGPREFGVESDVKQRLDLVFDDIDAPTTTDVASLGREFARRRWNEQNNRLEVPPSHAHAAAIIESAERLRAAKDAVLCHCSAGMSRAPAAALICLATWYEAGCESECVQEIRRLRNGAGPNTALVRFADELLDRHGKLIAAAKSLQSPSP